MNSERKKQNADLVDETVHFTPKPRASSTAQKQQKTKLVGPIKVPFSYSPNSTGNISMESLDIQPRISSEKLQQQRSLTKSLLQKTASKGYDLPTRYLKISDTLKTSSSRCSEGSESTVNESDFLRPPSNAKLGLEDKELSFTPADISTPRSSCGSTKSINSLGRISMSKHLAELSEQIKNTDISLQDLCEEFSKRSSIGSLNYSQSIEFDEEDESFASGEQAYMKLAERERSWKKQLDALGGNSIRSDSMFSQLTNNFTTQEEGISVSEFFRKKSELAELCLKDSPEKDSAPTPLIDESTTFESQWRKSIPIDDSVLSITEIEKVISSSNDNTAKIMDYISGNTAGKRNIKPKEKVKTQPQLISPCKSRHSYKENRRPCKDSYQDLGFKQRTTLEPLKESQSNYSDRSSNSSMRTASSLESLPGGKLPIETNCIELVWGCVPVGKRKIHTFTLRNRSQNKLRLQITSSNVNFRILNDHSEADPVSVLPILLHPAESRSISMMFTPSAIGGTVGKLLFAPISTQLQSQQTKKQQLMMYGYGGFSRIEIQNVSKDTNMKMWLTLGKLDHTSQLNQKFTLRNIGSLPAFSCLTFGSKALYGLSKVTVYPNNIVLKPKEQVTVNIAYTPTKDDAKHVFDMSNNQIIEVGYIQIISGEEPLRGRIRRLGRKVKQEAGVLGDPTIERLSNKFPNENMPADLSSFTETVGCMKELMLNLSSKEITLTLEKDAERNLIAGIDETSMFHSLAEGMSTMMVSAYPLASCCVEPAFLMLTPPMKVEDNVLLSSQCSKSLQFEVSSTAGDVLYVKPSAGILAPGESVLLKVSCDVRKAQQQQLCKVSIFVDDEVFDVDVKIVLLKYGNRK